MRNLDFSSWESIASTILGLALITLIGMGIRLLMMFTIQQRRERQNRQINERLKTLIAAYKVLGAAFTGDLSVDPRHLRDIRRSAAEAGETFEDTNERARRVRDTVEAALADIILLGTEEQVKLAQAAALDMVEGRVVQTAELVVSLRDFIRKALDLAPIPASLAIPPQGPARPAASGGKSGARGGEAGGGRGGGGGGGGGMGGGTGGGMGMGLSMGAGVGVGAAGATALDNETS